MRGVELGLLSGKSKEKVFGPLVSPVDSVWVGSGLACDLLCLALFCPCEFEIEKDIEIRLPFQHLLEGAGFHSMVEGEWV